jgi:hypothetical protein
VMEEGSAAAAIVRAGDTLIRLENTTQMTVAVQRPRDNKAVLDEALAVLELSPILVERAIYSKPVGRDEDDKMKHAEGLSIRSAEELRRIYGNNSVGGSVIADRTDDVLIGAVFVDMEKNTRFAVEKAVSKFYKTRKGQVVQHQPDRLMDVVVPAHMSKLLREVILRSLPAWLKAEFEAKARDLATKGKLPTLRKRMIESFAAMPVPVDEAAILRHLGKEKAGEITREDVVTMRGIYTAILEGEMAVETAFPPEPKQETGGKLPLTPKEGK